MNEEQVKILRMVAEGTISPEQGDELLGVIESEKGAAYAGADYIRRSAVSRPSPRTGVSAEAVKRLTQARIHGVDSTFIRELGEEGIGDLSLEELIELRVHGVSPQFVREMRDLGFSEMTAQELTELSVHGVDAKFVREMVDLGFVDLTPEQLTELRLQGTGATEEALEEVAVAATEER